MQIDQLKPIIEAALLASTQPMTVHQLGDLFNEDEEVGPQQIAQSPASDSSACAICCGPGTARGAASN